MKFVSVIDSCIYLSSRIRPIWFKHLILSKILSFLTSVLRLKSIFSQLRLHIYIVSGVEKQTEEMIRILFVGSENIPVFLTKMIFNEKPSIENKGTIFLWKIKVLEKKFADSADAMIVNVDQWYQRFLNNNFFVFPHMVNMILDTSKGLKDLIQNLPHSAIEDVKKVNKKQFTFMISSDKQKVKTLYFDFYQPTIKNIIGETDMFIPNFVFFKYLHEMGCKLMMASYKGKEISGVLFHHKDDTLLLKYIGVVNGDNTLIKKGAFSALYYFFIIYAKEQGVNQIDFEGARPFFNDGLFKYKKKWGMKIEPNSQVSGLFGLKIINKDCEPLKQFLFHNPFIEINKNHEFEGLVFIDENMDEEKVKEKVEKKYFISGMKGFRFIRL